MLGYFRVESIVTKGALRAGGSLFLDLGGLAHAAAQVIELRPPYVTSGDDLDLGQDRRVDRERALDADTETELAHREGFAGAGTLAFSAAAYSVNEDCAEAVIAVSHGPSTGPAQAVASDLEMDWHMACASPSFVSWLRTTSS